MSDDAGGWFYVSQGESKGPFSRGEMAALIRADAVGEHTKVWNSAMSDWAVLHQTDLRELLDGKQISPPPIVPAGSDRAASDPGVQPSALPHPLHPVSASLPRNNNDALAKFLTTLIYGGAVFGFLYIGRVVRADNKYAALLEMETGVWMVMGGILAIVTLIVFLIWKYRATSNLVALQGPQSVTPAGAVFWYFVPIAWFWKPYEAMRNLVQGYGAAEAQNLILWWVSFLAIWGIAIISAVITPDVVTTVQEANQYVAISLIGSVAEILWCIFGAALVRDINNAESGRINASVYAGQPT